MRVLSYNIHKGFSQGNTQLVLEAIRDSIRSVGAHLVFLQEVVGQHHGHSRKFRDYPTQSQFEFLADSVWPNYAYGKNAQYTEGHHGNAILSLLPIVAWHNLDLSVNRFEQRGLLHAVLSESSGTVLNVFCSHLNLFERHRRAQVKKIIDYIGRRVGPAERIILAGDFNDWRGSLSKALQEELGLSEAYKVLHGRHAKTFPSAFPLLRLDRIYFRNLTVLGAHCPNDKVWSRLSDHRPLVVDFDG